MNHPRTFPSVGLIVFISISLIVSGFIGICRHGEALERRDAIQTASGPDLTFTNEPSKEMGK